MDFGQECKAHVEWMRACLHDLGRSGGCGVLLGIEEISSASHWPHFAIAQASYCGVEPGRVCPYLTEVQVKHSNSGKEDSEQSRKSPCTCKCSVYGYYSTQSVAFLYLRICNAQSLIPHAAWFPAALTPADLGCQGVLFTNTSVIFYRMGMIANCHV